MFLWQRALEHLKSNKKKTYTYSELAAELGTTPRAIGAAMFALGRRGFTECNRVTFKDGYRR